MFVIFLRFSKNQSAAPDLMAEHNAWIARGFDDGVFQCVGSLKSKDGGAIIAVGESRAQIEQRVNEDPFVVHDVVTAQITEIDVKRTAPAFEGLKA